MTRLKTVGDVFGRAKATVTRWQSIDGNRQKGENNGAGNTRDSCACLVSANKRVSTRPPKIRPAFVNNERDFLHGRPDVSMSSKKGNAFVRRNGNVDNMLGAPPGSVNSFPGTPGKQAEASVKVENVNFLCD